MTQADEDTNSALADNADFDVVADANKTSQTLLMALSPSVGLVCYLSN